MNSKEACGKTCEKAARMDDSFTGFVEAIQTFFDSISLRKDKEQMEISKKEGKRKKRKRKKENRKERGEREREREREKKKKKTKKSGLQ